MLQYRLLVEVNDARRDVEKMAVEQLHSWLRRKNLDADVLQIGSESPLGPGATGSLAISERFDGSRSLRARIVERNSAGQWTTQLTVDVPGNRRTKPWLWLDLDGPDDVTARVPGLARQLLEVFEATTQDIRQGEAQPVQTRDDVHALVEAVCDASRRRVVFVAGSDPRLPFDQWLALVRNLLRDTVGLAGGYVLSPDATETFNNAIGPGHEVRPWTVRTFRPGVEPDDAEDARRHKVLGRDRIINDPIRRLAPMLGRRALEVALQTPLPTAATKIDRAFAQITNSALLDKLDKLASPAGQPAVPASPAPQPEHGTSAAPVLDDSVVQALDLIFGGDLTVERILELGGLAELAHNAQASRSAIAARLDTYETQVAELNSKVQELRDRLEDTQLEAAIAQEEHANAAADVRRLQKLLINSDQAERIWISDEDPANRRPQAYEELADRLNEWAHVSFTGDVDKLLELDEHDEAAAWAAKIWDVLGALDDYARVVLDDTFSGGVHQYLTDTPPGCRTFSANRHAPDESDDVHTNPQYSALRMLRVPRTVSPDEAVFMGAHFKIAQLRTVSPRLHYYNDVRNTGMVYVGYIGKHLKTARTN